MQSIQQIEDHLIGMGHGSTLNKIRNKEALYERAASKLLFKAKPLEIMRLMALVQPVYDNLFNYALPTDFLDIIDLIPQDNRQSWDKDFRKPSGVFDLQKAFSNRTISIEGNNGAKFIRINWKTNPPVLLNSMDGYNSNGIWLAVGAATGVATDTIFKQSGGGSVVFNHNVSGDGIKNLTMSPVDLTLQNGVSSETVGVFLSNIPSAIHSLWGNDLSTKFWTATPITTQADGTPFQVGWNTIKFDWSAAVQTGVVDPSKIVAAQITLDSTTGALGKIRIENIQFAIGRNFDIKYYSKYFFMTAAGVWESRPQAGISTDLVLVDNDSLPIFLYECLKEMAQQMEGTDAAFDINYALAELKDLYPILKAKYPNQSQKQVGSYGGRPRFGASSIKRYRRY